MQTISIEVASVDDDLAEKAVRAATSAISTLIPLRPDTLHVEPHDDVRGIWAHVYMDDPEKMSSSFHKYVISAYKALIQLYLQQVTSAVIHVDVHEKEEI